MQEADNPTYQPLAPPGGIPAKQFRQSGSSQILLSPKAVGGVALQQTQAADSQSKFRKKQQARKELKQAIGHSNEILVSAQTVFPLTLFPDTVTIDRGKLNISHRFFFKVAEVTSIRIEDILNAIANVGPFFGSLKISTRFFGGEDKVYHVNYLRRGEAIKISRILQGYIIALRKGIDCSALSTAELSQLLFELGSGDEA